MQILRISLLIILPIFFSCDKSKDAWKTAKSENSIQSYQKYIEDYPNSTLKDSVIYYSLRLYQFGEASKKNTILAYQNFINSYGRGSLVDSAKSQIEKIHFRQAKILNTYSGYSNFLQQYPLSFFADSVNAQIDVLKRLRHRDFQFLNTAKIILDSRLPGDAEISFNNSIQEELKKALKASGLNIVEPTEKSDIIIKIDVSGKALRKTYSWGEKLYSGAEITGSIILFINEKVIETYQFKGTFDPPDFIQYVSGHKPYERPEDAPYFRALFLKYSFVQKLIEILNKYLGYPSLVGLFESPWESYDYIIDSDFDYFDRLSIKKKRDVSKSLIFLLDNKKCNQDALVFLLGHLRDKSAMRSIMESTADNSTIKDAMEKITKKKFKTFDDLIMWWKEDINDAA